jgi:methanogenic corrinoid protein MtbC1
MRTASGYRLYDDDAIATLARVRRLIEAGWSASEASRAVLAGEAPPDTAHLDASQRQTGDHRHEIVARFVEAARVRDVPRTGAAIDEMLALGSFEQVVDDILMPALVALGEAWAEGRLDVAAEHAAAAAVERRLAALYEAAALMDGPSVVVGLPPGARHELGALAFAVALRRLGVGVLYLGADVPVASWIDVMREPRHRLAVIGIVRADDRGEALAVIRGVGEVSRRPVAVGGASAEWDAGIAAGAVLLPHRIRDAASAAAAMVHRVHRSAS